MSRPFLGLLVFAMSCAPAIVDDSSDSKDVLDRLVAESGGASQAIVEFVDRFNTKALSLAKLGRSDAKHTLFTWLCA